MTGILLCMTDKPDSTVALGTDLRQRRKLLGLTQLDVAGLSGVNRETVVRAEAGDEGVALGTFRRIAAALGLEVTLEPVYRSS